ncbi:MULTISPECIES: SAV_2336 N-terminal domain-related protein [unclassified Streptomyces]|uniref:SAV_2336 N-terminal domain-related protein n=1 Tax=unclassified Streptomyces TaxID=2593676 RepID=UPI000F6F20A3|nr:MULTISPECIES: SAV_2336 N-terminal domain-related protein [unclassified Streptomyces]AZM62460.1 protein kinase [Streptomyces sp. WAC 01438]RSM93513.1 protein kinase [Streptomyces sp. WAC 01420]
MPSDPPAHHPGSPDALARLADVLGRAAGGVRPTSLELAELLWLARTMEHRPDAPARPPRPPREPAAPGPAVPDPPSAPPPPAPAPPPPPAQAEPPRAPLRLPSPADPADPDGPGPSPGLPPKEPHTALLAPAPPMLRRPLALQRSLRPLKRRVDAPLGSELDERATADRIARLGSTPDWWLPVMRPARERWLRLTLVHDTGPTMPVWRPLVRELHTALAQSGIFRTVALLSVGADGTVRGAGAHTPADGREVTLVISDCMGPQWRAGRAGELWYGTLRRWSRRMPVAVVQPLPEHLWRDTALPATPGLLSAPHPVAPSATLAFTPYDFTPYDASGPGHRLPPEGMLPLPVLEPAPEWLSNWARLVAAPGGTAFPGAVADLRPAVLADAGHRADLGRLTPEELVLRFRGSASPEAFRLAGHLALGRPDLPVMRLVQAAIDPDPRPQHIAEVILSGLLTAVPGPPGSYAFRPGVPELLLRSLPRSARYDTAALLERVGALIEDRAGRVPGEFQAFVPAPSGTAAGVDGEAFASVGEDSARRMTGGEVTAVPPGPGEGQGVVVARRYRLVRRLSTSGALWQAEDPQANRTVVLRLHPTITDPERRTALRRDVRLLEGLGHPNLVRVLGTGFHDGVLFVVMERLDGVPLNSLAAPDGYGLPPTLLVSVGAQLARALTAVHAVGLTYGGLNVSRVMLLPDGTVRLTLAEPGRTPGPAGRAQDLRALGEVLLMLTWGSARPPVPVQPDDLGPLPPELRATYAHVLDLLMSSSPEKQLRGRDLLLDPELARRAEAAYTRRFYRMLGRFGVELDSGPADLGPNERAVLAMLLLQHGRTVTFGELQQGVWSTQEKPRDASKVLDATAARLRRVLGRGVLGTLPDGFVLHTSPDHVDLLLCDSLVRGSDEARRKGDLAEARLLLSDALALWSDGAVLAGVPGPAARSARTRLVRLRLDLHRKLAEIDLDLGAAERASADLGRLVAAHPFREDLRRLHVLALRLQGRTEEALAAYEEYEMAGGQDPELLALGRELREEAADGTPQLPPLASEEPAYDPLAAPDELPDGVYPAWDPSGGGPSAASSEPVEPGPAHQGDARTCFRFDLVDPESSDTLAALGRAVTRILTACGLPYGAYELFGQDESYTVVVWSIPLAEPLLRAALRGFPDMLREVGLPRLMVTAWRAWQESRGELPDEPAVRAVLVSSGAHGVFALAPSLRRELARDRDLDALLRPLDAGDGAAGWYVTVPRGPAPTPPVLGPYPLPAGHLPPSLGLTRTVVYGRPGEEWDTVREHDTDHYYEVDLAERRTVLEAQGEPGPAQTFVAVVQGEAVWRVSDPVALIEEGPRDPEGFLGSHFLKQVREVARRLPSDGLWRLRQTLMDRLGLHDVPGCAVRWKLTVSAQPLGPGARPTVTDPAAILRAADAVILGFDGTLTTLWPPSRASEIVQDLARLAGDERERPAGLTPAGLLRELADHPSVQQLRVELNRYESAAAHTARPEPLSVELVRELSDRRLGLAVVTDHAADAADTFLMYAGLDRTLRGGAHGRSADLARLMPHPDVLHRALRRLGTTPDRCVMIGSTAVESAAAAAAGVPFIGCRHAEGILRSSGPPCLVVEGLGAVLDTVRSLPPRSTS